MTNTEQPPQKEAAFFTAIREWNITRGRDGMIGGVVDGLGQRVGLARLPARIIVVIAAVIFNGLVLVAYAAAWGLLPDRDGNIIIQNFGRGITNVGALIGILVLTMLGFGGLDNGFFNWGIHRPDSNWFNTQVDGFGRYDGPIAAVLTFFAIVFFLVALGALIFGVVYLIRRSNRNAGQGPAPTSGTAAHDPGATSADAATPDQATSPFAATAASDPAEPRYAAPAYATPPQPRPPTPRVPGPGRVFYLLTLAWALISGAIIAWTDRMDRLAVAPGVAWFALFTVGFGLILVGIAAVGRKLGFLGFISVPLLLAGMLVSVNSGQIGDAYDRARDVFEVDFAEGPFIEEGQSGPEWVEPERVDATASFTGDYQQVYFAPLCFDYDLYVANGETYGDSILDADGENYSSSQARLTYDALPESTTVDVVAEVTTVTVPEGTNVELKADQGAQSTVLWESRGIACDFVDGGQTNFSVLNTDQPTLTLVVHDDMFANTIEIKETVQP